MIILKAVLPLFKKLKDLKASIMGEELEMPLFHATISFLSRKKKLLSLKVLVLNLQLKLKRTIGRMLETIEPELLNRSRNRSRWTPIWHSSSP